MTVNFRGENSIAEDLAELSALLYEKQHDT